jgi:type II pantothenate kinase
MVSPMSVVIGIDIGGSSTKIVGFSSKGGEWSLIEPQIIKANDPVTATYGAFGKFTDENNLAISDISRVMMTGVGASHVKHNLYGLDCQRVAEFDSIGRGGTYLSGLSEALVVSMGTGTAMVHAKADGTMKYLGGTGVGGGTLIGLSRLLLNAETIDHIEKYAEGGSLDNIDLRIKDISSNNSLDNLEADLTAANFGKLSDIASKDDVALGIMNLVFETIGMVSIFAARSVGVKNIILTGNVTRFAHCKRKFDEFNHLEVGKGLNFIIPKRSRFSTAIGAAIIGMQAEMNK